MAVVTAAAVTAPGVYFLTETEHLGCFEAGSTGVGFRVAIAVPLTVALRATQTVAVTLTVAVTEAVTLSVATKDRQTAPLRGAQGHVLHIKGVVLHEVAC